ncbi:MAG: sigma-70 family RNA polymerase sigma factor [Pseudomonadota bacterium]
MENVSLKDASSDPQAAYTAVDVSALEMPVGNVDLSSDVQACVCQNRQIERIYEAHARPLTTALRAAYGSGPPDPEDAMQQAFRNVIERGDLSTIKNLKGFLWITARNIVLASKRADAVRTRYDYEVEELFFPMKGDKSTPERISLVKDQLRVISEALRKMPKRRRRAVFLHRVEGLSFAEIGRQLGISRQNAARHVTKGIADLDIAFTFDGERSPL